MPVSLLGTLLFFALLAVLAAAAAGLLLRSYLLTYRKEDPYAYG